MNNSSGDGSGYGSGYGSGDGSGYGLGYGSGDDSDYGSGYGSGNSSGNSSGYDSGYGYGDSSGNSSGYDSDYGYGSGSNLLTYNDKLVEYIDNTPTVILSKHGDTSCGFIINNDLTTTPCFVAKSQGYTAHGETLKEAVSCLQDKIINNMPIDKKIQQFNESFHRGVSYRASEFYRWHNVLTGSCEMGRKQFMRNHDIEDDDKFTVEEFIALTKENYGGSIIKQIEMPVDRMTGTEVNE
jgi:hypothetical protein